MSDVEIVVGIRGDTSGGRTIKRSLDDIAQSGDKAVSASKRLELQSKATGIAAGAMARAFAAAGAVFGASQIIKMADGYRLLEARVNSITGSVKETTRVMGELRKISDQTGSSMEASVAIMQRLSFARDEIKATNNDMLVFTETVTKMGIMSGASADALKNGLTQLGQALSSDIMRAEEFNSVMENTPGIGKAIADQFGVTTGQLRQLVINGQVLRDDVFAAILNQAKQTRQEFEKFPRTAEQGFNQMLGRLTQVVDEVNKATNGTNALGASFRLIGDTVKRVYDGISAAFEFAVAGIAEMLNLIIKGFNLAIDGMNKLKAITPFADKTPISKFNTVDAGSIIGEATSNAVTRNNRLFADSTKDIEVETRKISQNYSEIASKLGTGNKLTKEQKETLKEQKKIQDALKNAVKESRTETEELYDKIAEQERLKPFAKTAEQANAISKNIKNARDELEKLRVKAELNGPVAKAFASLASEIDDGFKDAFKDAFTQSDGGFKALLNGWKNTFKNFLAELAYQALARPIIVSLVGSVGGVMGLSNNAVASVLSGSSGGSAGGLGGIGNLSSIFGGVQNLLSGGTSSTLIGGVNKLGSLLGIGGVGANGPVSLSSFSSFTNGSFGGSLGAGIGSFGGNFLANSLFGNRGIGANIGGTIGGIAGSFIPIPIAGPLIGSFLGNALGGLFGGSKPSDKVQGGSINLSTLEKTTNGMTGSKFSQENADFRDKFFTEVENVVNLLKSVGGTTTGQLDVAIGNRDGLRLNDMTSGRNFGNDANAFIKAAMEVVVKQTTGLSETFQKILDKVGVGDTQKLAAAFSFGQFYESLTAKPVDVLKESIDALNAQFDEMRKMATELGFPLDKINEAYEAQKTTIEGSIKAQMAGFQTLEDMNRTFKSFFDGQALGANSTLTPVQKLQLAQDNFGSLLSKAQGGDLSVTQDLLKSANDLLGIGRDVYASSVSFAGLEGFVRSSVSGIAKQAGYVGTDTTSSLTSEIIRGNTQLNGSVSEMVELIRDLYNEAVRTRKLQESIRNQTAAA
jgi:tape measure domain-containing protein